ncbi:FUSC family protein [Namhaeicola litoreus]|uniref:FUSC family membrane protein n=1 Tax=Namhaeicola litoreus TaxID=1052145 RepID=A0ABW3Y2H6_9FLAO
MILDYLKTLVKFFKSADFYRGFILTAAILIPIIFFYYAGNIYYALPVAFGVLLSAPNDIQGSRKRKVYGILFSIGLTLIVSTLVILVKPYFISLALTITLLTFLCSLFAVYGFRGSLLAFSGLFAIVLALAYNNSAGIPPLTHILLLGLGGVWYLIFSSFLFVVTPKKDEDELLTELLNLTGDYLKLRAGLLSEKKDRKEIQLDQLKLQTQISDKHEVLREILLTTRKSSGRSHFDEKRLLIFISLVDILEYSLANTLDYNKVDLLFKEHQKTLEPFAELNQILGNHLKVLAKVFAEKDPIPDKSVLLNALTKADAAVEKYVHEVGLPKARDGALLLRNILTYQESQVNEIRSIRRALANVKNSSRIVLKREEASQFITHQEYRWSIVLENFSLKSPIFRHALRITIAVIIGFLLGSFFGIQHMHWIILTIIVIMRPNYGLTKQRSINRFIGTIIGGLFSLLIIYFTQNTYVYLFFAISALTIGFAMVKKNYRTAAAFITIHVIFVFAIIEKDAFHVIEFRLLDTMIGAFIAMLANYFILPNWEYLSMKQYLSDTLKKNRGYLEAVHQLYHSKKISQLGYRKPRKEAFLAMSNLNASFERMTQDPKSKQKEFEWVYEMVTLNNTILSAIASLGSFIQNKKGSYVLNDFDVLIDNVEDLLRKSQEILESGLQDELFYNQKAHLAEEELLKHYKGLERARDEEIERGMRDVKQEMLINLQEAHLMHNQLVWLKNLSQDLLNVTAEYVNNE